MTTLENLKKKMAEKGHTISKRKPLSLHLGNYQEAVEKAFVEMREQQIMRRIWAHDHTVWKSDPKEITNRLGWLHVVEEMVENIDRLKAFSEAVWADGFTHALLMGMGGSSLAPEVFQKTFGREKAKERGYKP